MPRASKPIAYQLDSVSPRALYALAFASGVAALAYEVSWMRLLSLTFGSSTLAASAAVAGFMGGMGIGAWLYHRVQERVEGPLRLYAFLEVGIALAAFGLTALLWGLPPLFAALASLVGEGAMLTVVRIVSVLLLLLVPTALMGATYPALCAVAIGGAKDADRHLGTLYGVSTIGAACGALAAGLWWLPEFGIRTTVLVGNGINLAIAGVALALALRSFAGRPARVTAKTAEPIGGRLPLWVTATVVAASGFATLGYEIVWFRAIRYVVGNSTFAFTIILVVFLAGLGLGSLGLRRVLARRRPEADLGLLQLGIAIAAALALSLLAWVVSSPAAAPLSIFHSAFRSLPWWLRLAIHGGLAFALMLPATLLMGLVFPLGTRLLLGDLQRLSRRIGLANLLANLGGVSGSICAAVLLIPSFGSLGASRALVLLNLALAALVAFHLRGRVRALMLGACVVVGLAVQLSMPSQIDFRGAAGGGGELIFNREAELATVQVFQHPSRAEFRLISIDGVVIGVSRGWQYDIYSKQILLAHLPLVLEPRIRSALQIGLGSASTLDALAGHDELELLQGVEINGAIIDGSRFFDESRVLNDKRVDVAVEDAIHFLLRSGQRYDLIVSDGKQNEDFSGNSKLLSREFYRYALDRLTENGLFVQWIPLGLEHKDFKIVMQTAMSVFPHLEVFYEPRMSVLIVGAREPIRGRPRMDQARYEASRAAEDMRLLGLPTMEQLLRSWIADKSALAPECAGSPVNEWNTAPLEYNAYFSLPRLQGLSAAENLELLLRANARALERGPALFAQPDAEGAEALALVRQSYVASARNDVNEVTRSISNALQRVPGDPLVQRAQRRLTPALSEAVKRDQRD